MVFIRFISKEKAFEHIKFIGKLFHPGCNDILGLKKYSGTHNELIKRQDVYSNFINIRQQAVGWKI